jgi:hypothetical protein
MNSTFALTSSTYLPWRYLALLGGVVAMLVMSIALSAMRHRPRVTNAVPCARPCARRTTPCARPCNPCPPCPYAGHGHWGRAHS